MKKFINFENVVDRKAEIHQALISHVSLLADFFIVKFQSKTKIGEFSHCWILRLELIHNVHLTTLFHFNRFVIGIKCVCACEKFAAKVNFLIHKRYWTWLMSVLHLLSCTHRLNYKYNTCYTNFRWSLSAYMERLEFWSSDQWAPALINNQCKLIVY